MKYKTTLRTNEPVAITIGNFDGIHKGHQRLLHELSAMAQTLQCTPVMVTFSPHILMVVRPEIYVRYLTTLEEKLALAKHYGNIPNSIVIEFTPEVAAMTAEAFMDNLCARFPLKGLVVGEDFRLGHNRMGDIHFLKHYGEQHTISVQAIVLEEAEKTRISSTRIRSLVNEGSISEANELLGHPVIVSGIVQHGDQRGRTIGFPTANLRPDPHKLLPADGVYVTRIRVHHDTESDLYTNSTVYNGVTNIGVRPTFNGQERLVEAHILDKNLDLYDKAITVEFITRLRGEQRFSGIEALKSQIAADANQARQLLEEPTDRVH
ncbi:MAG TPA: bifunctional riboflavin kinase/FAD synthetase [Ktedonosporobacter sp.]|nr:bifunctional riboflavin kinase/FAD synthetase [Ktedonosporobacter sp.]